MTEPVPVLEVNPSDPNEVEISFVPVEDLDDFLEDIESDYELGFGELGAVSKLRGQAKLKGRVKVRFPKVRKIGRKIFGKVKGAIRRLARARVRGRVRTTGKVRKLLRVAKGRSSRVPLNRKAIIRKAKARKLAHNIVALGGSKKVRPAAKRAVGAAIIGLPLRPKKLKKPAKKAVRALRAANVRCCILASRRDGCGQGGMLRDRYLERRRVNACCPMTPPRFNGTLRVLIQRLEAKNTSPSIDARIQRLKKLSGIQNIA